MPEPFDNLWNGPLETVAAAIEGQPNVLGPRDLDGVAYVNVRTDAALPIPAGLKRTGPELSAVILGVWAVAEPEVQSTAPTGEPL
ncbi:MAG TPA: hypothetical protein VNR89_04115 [Roseomonas sp.]|nr:hypothetical protein [Roseomonas sp.]